MTATSPSEFAQHWLTAWNDHDVEAVLGHFSDDVVFRSPVAVQLLDDSDGVIRGKEALRRYWTEALAKVPDLRFELLGVYGGVDAVVIHYRNQKGGLVNEVLLFADGLVREGYGTYLATDDNLAGAKS
jgi:ketosteroid isomerase-like protein